MYKMFRKKSRKKKYIYIHTHTVVAADVNPKQIKQQRNNRTPIQRNDCLQNIN